MRSCFTQREVALRGWVVVGLDRTRNCLVNKDYRQLIAPIRCALLPPAQQDNCDRQRVKPSAEIALGQKKTAIAMFSGGWHSQLALKGLFSSSHGL